jgi:hypothetical protein
MANPRLQQTKTTLGLSIAKELMVGEPLIHTRSPPCFLGARVKFYSLKLLAALFLSLKPKRFTLEILM